jgi:TRAP transporter 4TM/12TM fusion protein
MMAGAVDPRSSLQALRNHMYPSGQRQPDGAIGWIVSLAAIGLIIATLWMGIFGTIGQVGTNALHLALAIPLVFLLYPAFPGEGAAKTPPSTLDLLLAFLAFAAYAWALWSERRFSNRMIYVDSVEWYDLIMGVLAIALALEATRRTLDMVIVWMTLGFGLYALTGPYWPHMFEHRGVPFVDLIEHLYLVPEGLFNVLMTIAATFLFTFLLFGALLQASGGERGFMDLAMSIAGHRRGGPAKVATVGSALMGTLSGSTVSNVVTTGTITIPLMKRIGYKPEEAAAIETVAGVGGALMPPVMGAGVFLMTAFTGVPLITILQYSVLPAILYYAALYFYVDIKARKNGIDGLPRDQLPILRYALVKAAHLFVPIAVLCGLMMYGFTPYLASSVCVIVLYLVAMSRKSTRLSFGQLLVALEASTRAGLTVSTLSAASALVFGVMTKTALLVKATSIFLALAGGSLFVLIVLIAIASYFIGLAMPVTATYVIVAALGAGALGELGVPILAAHLIIFWHAQNATISPPIAITAHVAATIAKADSSRTAYQAVMIANTLYVIPFFFAYGQLVDITVPWFEVVWDAVALGLFFFAAAVVFENHWFTRTTPVERASFALAAALALFAPIGKVAASWPWLVAAAVVFAIAYVLHYRRAQAGPTRSPISPGGEA